MATMKNNKQNLSRLLLTYSAAEDPLFRKKLLKLGADVNYCEDHENPLIFALIYEKSKKKNNVIPEYVIFLVEHGANVNLKARHMLPLQFAISINKATVEFLIDYGADIHMIDGSGKNLLHSVDDPEIARFLINKGLDVNAKDFSGISIPMINQNIIDLDMLKYMVKHKLDIHYHMPEYGSLLHIFYSQPDIIEYLLDLGVDPNIKNRYGELPIHHIAHCEPTLIKNKELHNKIVFRLLEETNF